MFAAAAFCLGAAVAAAEEPVTHQSTATSSASVTVLPDGTVAMSASNAHLIPYTLFNTGGDHPTVFARLAAVTTSIRKRSDAEGIDPSSTVMVTIDDLSGPTPHRLAEFTDPGAEGKLIDERYFSSTVFGCCGGVDRHRVRATETGVLLFLSTGAGDLGRVTWADIPNARPPLTRWAAFDGGVEEADLAKGVVGTLAYGGESGATTAVRLRLKATREDLIEKNLELSSGAELGWIDGKRQGAPPAGFQQGDVGSPIELWIDEGAKSPADIGGFVLALRLGGHSLAVIPVTGDRLILGQARLAPGFSFVAVAP